VRIVRQLLGLLFLVSILVSCKPNAWSATSNTSNRSNSNAASSDFAAPQEIPQIVSALEVPVEVDWTFTAYSPTEPEQHYQEKLYSNGVDKLSLDLLAYAEGSDPLVAPTVELAELHERRQIFLARFRNLSLNDAELAKHNYRWSQVEGNFQMAGRPVDKFQLKSNLKVGDAVLFVDQQSHMLMGWDLYDPAGGLLQQLITQSVNFQPDFNGVVWAEVPVTTLAYLGSSSDLVLGFAPLKLTDSGPGFESSIQKMLLTESSGPVGGISNIHLSCLSDGLRTIFVAQRETGNSVGVGGSKAKVATLSYAYNGGTTVLEGGMYTKWVYGVGSIPLEDLLMIVNSLVE
jgi:hypothetical protein